MTRKLSLTTKSWLLILSGSLVANLCMYFSLVYFSGTTVSELKWFNSLLSFQGFKEIVAMLVLGCFVVALVGVPVLHLIEHYLSRYKLRYIFGSVFSGYFLYSLLNTFPQWQGVWVFVDGRYGLPPVVYLVPAVTTGLVFTFLVCWLESSDRFPG